MPKAVQPKLEECVDNDSCAKGMAACPTMAAKAAGTEAPACCDKPECDDEGPGKKMEGCDMMGGKMGGQMTAEQRTERMAMMQKMMADMTPEQRAARMERMKKMMAAKGGECSSMGKDSECSSMGTAACPSTADAKSCDSKDGEVCLEEENCDGDCEGGACNKADAAAKYLPKKDGAEAGSCCEEGKAEETPAKK